VSSEGDRVERERQRGPGEAPNLGTPSEPRPAASVVLLRRGGKHRDRALEVLLLKRTEEARFMPGVWVFPGGGVDPCDGQGEAGFRACAVRELAEEAAIELAAGEELILFSRWITPEVISTRFDAWFFLALAPAHTPPEADGSEIVEASWFEPRAALDAHAAGELILAFPTVSQLEELSRYASADEALGAYRGREVAPILPKVVGSKEDHRVVLPGDPDYPDTA
jgi:8-oxo-dGTP pyrophosphatase MutT (NUDIX family)